MNANARRRKSWCSIAACVIAIGGMARPLRAQDTSLALETELKRLASTLAAGALSTDVSAALARLYAPGAGRWLWSANGHPTPQARALLRVVEQVETRGLRTADYSALGIAALIDTLDRRTDADPPEPAVLARMDVLASRALLTLLHDLSLGRADPRALGLDLPERGAGDLAELALKASGAADLPGVIASVEPPYVGYAALVALLDRYRTLAADSTLVLPPLSRTIRPNDPYSAAPRLRRLLSALGDLPPSALFTTEPDRYAGALVLAVMSFQRRHGLTADGVLGPDTRAELAVPLTDRIEQIELTLERWRWLPAHAPERYIVVNIPAFRLYAFENDSIAAHPVMSMNVVVGEAAGYHDTPVFVGEMRAVVFRPYWDVPPKIARKELVPAIRRGTIDMESEGYEIVGTGSSSRVYPATRDNLARVAAGTLRLRQRPGRGNALGLVKFVFPNRHDVYLHGTPAMQLFGLARRDFSHGCIRAQQPAELASFALDGDSVWTSERIDAAMHGDATVRVALTSPVTVYILYMTVMIGPDGTAYFYPDLYEQDERLSRALARFTLSPRVP